MEETKMKETEMKETKTNKIIINGVMTSAYYGKSKMETNSEPKTRLAIHIDEEEWKRLKEFATPYYGNKDLTPAWLDYDNYSDAGDNGVYVNLKSNYVIPTRYNKQNYPDILTNDVEYSDRLIGSVVKVAINFKPGAFYPSAIVITELGEERNPFDGME